jgi:hypothetical protein
VEVVEPITEGANIVEVLVEEVVELEVEDMVLVVVLVLAHRGVNLFSKV